LGYLNSNTLAKQTSIPYAQFVNGIDS